MNRGRREIFQKFRKHLHDIVNAVNVCITFNEVPCILADNSEFLDVQVGKMSVQV